MKLHNLFNGASTDTTFPCIYLNIFCCDTALNFFNFLIKVFLYTHQVFHKPSSLLQALTFRELGCLV